mgnify:CR=1 FL=1
MSLKITLLDDFGKPKQVDGSNQIELKPEWIRSKMGLIQKLSILPNTSVST